MAEEPLDTTRSGIEGPAGLPGSSDPLEEVLGSSPPMVALREVARRLLSRQTDARRLSPILLEGETGTGKGLLAQALHRAGPRHHRPFVSINCAAIPEHLLEAELFGHEKGVFTDAHQARPGLFLAANHGTIFLDEIGTLPDGLQPKLLKAIEERSVRRLGSTRSEPIDVWILAAANEDLAAATQARRFREDLYHRLAVLTLRMPPLRERDGDVILLAEHFLERACADYDMPGKSLAPDAREALLRHAWPGNVRQLANVIERVVLLSDAPVVTAAMLDLPAATPRAAAREAGIGAADAGPEQIMHALHENGWNISRTAAHLGISRNTLRYRMEKYRLRPGAPVEASVGSRPLETPPGPVAGRGGPAAAPSVGGQWERRRVALLRAVIAAAGDGAVLVDASKVLNAVLEKIEGFGGRIDETGPSEVTAAFGLEPVDDAPRRAVLAALAIQNAVERYGHGPAFRVKVGIHIVRVMLRRIQGVVEIHPEARQSAWEVLAALTAGEPGRILIEAADRATSTAGLVLGLEALGTPAAPQPSPG